MFIRSSIPLFARSSGFSWEHAGIESSNAIAANREPRLHTFRFSESASGADRPRSVRFEVNAHTSSSPMCPSPNWFFLASRSRRLGIAAATQEFLRSFRRKETTSRGLRRQNATVRDGQWRGYCNYTHRIAYSQATASGKGKRREGCSGVV